MNTKYTAGTYKLKLNYHDGRGYSTNCYTKPLTTTRPLVFNGLVKKFRDAGLYTPVFNCCVVDVKNVK